MSCFYKILDFTQSNSNPLDDLAQRTFQKIPKTYKKDKPKNITGVVENHLKCDFINGSIDNGI